ncbi:MAG: phosphatase PAP2 family protein [Chitinophagaceae bacterium]|nr:phosphatase PAP2 family protein [Chitinophagaceae bacterium]MCZ2396052.1 phosphatase PAP2 family protein [Chitinophagales bacterium]
MNVLQTELLTFLPAPILRFDQSLFHKINGEWTNSFLDFTLPFVREPFFWAPLYIFLGLFALLNFKGKGIWWVLAFLILVMVSDFTSSSVIKEAFFRLRPCRDPEMAGQVRFIVKYCPVSSSFVSSHAVNHFAISTFIFATFRKPLSNWWALILLWAALVCYAQVYVGVHYPVDVLAGGLFGVFLGGLTATIFNRLVKLHVES